MLSTNLGYNAFSGINNIMVVVGETFETLSC